MAGRRGRVPELVLALAVGALFAATAGGCVVTDNPGLPFDVHAQRIGLADRLSSKLDVTSIQLRDGTTIEANGWEFVTHDPQPGDLVLSGDHPTWVATFSPDGTAGEGPCYRVDGDAELMHDGIRLTLREPNKLPVRFTVDLAPEWKPPGGDGSRYQGGSTCLDAMGRAVGRR